MKILAKLTAIVTALIMAASFMVACKDDEKTPEAPSPNLYDLTGFTIVREYGSSSEISGAISDLKAALKDTLGLELPVATDIDKEAGSKEIIIGDTDRMESQVTITQLKKKNKKNSWTIRIANDRIVITGTDSASTAKGVEAFTKNYVRVSSAGSYIDISAGNEMIGIYDKDSIITAKNGAELLVEIESVTLSTTKRYNVNGGAFVPKGGSYPSITKLQYQGDESNNGKLIAIAAASTQNGVGDPSTNACVMMSDNDGKTWNVIARPKEKFYPGTSCGTMASIYELPAKVGDMPAGTLLYSHNVVDYDRFSVIAVWRSFDAGHTWEEYTMIDEGGGLHEGVWEPFMIYCEEDQYLYCFYSDDSDPDHDQKIVYKRSKDGIHWEGKDGKVGTGTGKDVEPVDVIASNEAEDRPGMPVITKMGNGEYFMAYEYFDDDEGCPIRYKTTKNLADWGNPAEKGTIIGMWSSPSCAWIDSGGENGMLVVAAKGGSNNGYMMVSFDYGKTWEKIEDPHTSSPIKEKNDRVGYSGFMFVTNDKKTIYYVNSINDPSDPKNKQTIGFVKMYIYE